MRQNDNSPENKTDRVKHRTIKECNDTACWYMWKCCVFKAFTTPP